jgi:hypothetical protein
LAIGAFKESATFREGINIGRVDLFFSVAPEFRAKVIHRDEEDVKFLRGES